MDKTEIISGRLIWPERRTDKDFAVSWIRGYGKGRVFYCFLGHNPQTFWNPSILQHYLAGIQFALGDLPAEATPSNKAGLVKN
jgi:type 1 glutamine amidotransferase